MSGSSQLSLTPQMDVYSYAILCVEIVGMGRLPWPLMDDEAVRRFVLGQLSFFPLTTLLTSPDGLVFNSRKCATTAPHFTFQHSSPPGPPRRVLAPQSRHSTDLLDHRAGSERHTRELFAKFARPWRRPFFGDGRRDSSLCPEDFVGRGATGEVLSGHETCPAVKRQHAK